jgi:hypothetical protein
MAVLKRYVPEPIDIKDYRDRPGVFYEAKCEQCGRIFYPKRGTAKYCSKQCGIEYRNGGVLTKKDDKKLSISTQNEKEPRPVSPAIALLRKRRAEEEAKREKAKQKREQKARLKRALKIAEKYKN